jgi:uncharacterized protein (TIGR03437 family)
MTGLLLAGICAALTAAPSLRTSDPVVNAASYARGIAPGSIFVVIGSELSGPNTVVADSFPLRTTMNATSIQFRSTTSGQLLDAFMIYTTRNQIAGLLPSDAPTGDYDVSVRYSGLNSPFARVSVFPRNIGIFTANSAGFGPAQVLNKGELELNRFAQGQLGQYVTRPATPGMRLDLYGTGVGADPLSDSSGGSSGHQTGAGARVVVGGVAAQVAYSGRSQGTAGLDQMVFTLPSDVPLGCNVTAQVFFGNGQRSNPFTLSIARPGDNACDHPYLPVDALRSVSEGQTIGVGVFHISRQIVHDARSTILGSLDYVTEFVGGAFRSYGIGDLGEVPVVPPAPGRCVIFQRTARAKEMLFGPYSTNALDAGSAVYLNGPSAMNLPIPRSQDRNYPRTVTRGFVRAGDALPRSPIEPYFLSGFGGSEVGAFAAQTTRVQPVEWTNRSQITDVDRSQNLRFAWSGGGGSVVMAFAVSGERTGGSVADPIINGTVFLCSELAQAGSLTITPQILQQLPAGTGILGLQTVTPGSSGNFTSTLANGSQLAFGQFYLSVGATKSGSFR